MQALPSSGANMIGCATGVINLYYLAHGKDADSTIIAGFGLGCLLLDVAFVSFGFGLNGALETFVSQSFGQGNHHLCSVYLHRSRVVVTLCFVVTFFLLQYSEAVLLYLDQDRIATKNA